VGNPISVNYMQRTSAENKERVRAFYGDVLAWELEEIHPGLDIFSCEEITYGVQYLPPDKVLLSNEQFRSATWMSIKAEDRKALIAKMKQFGVTELPEQSDDNNFFFQAPGGQVYVC
jgi:predicted enzyme related to lactoylglutathione lyase